MKHDDSMINEFINKAGTLRRKAAQKSLLNFARLYLSDHLRFPPSKAHLEIYDLLFEMLKNRGKKVAIAAPRDFGKSTMITLIYILYCICYAEERFVVIISNTASQAMKILENVKKELTENTRLNEDFPEICEVDQKPKPPRWTRMDIITRNNVEVLALGSEQQIRGRRHGSHRPTLVIADDLEDAENTFSEETNEKRKEWFSKSVLKVGSEGTNFLIIGNLHHPRSMLAEYVAPDLNITWTKRTYKALVTNPTNLALWEKWKNVYQGKEKFNGFSGLEGGREFYKANKVAMDEGAELIWPERWSLINLMESKENDEISFMSEMQNSPMDISSMTFKPEEFRYWDKRYSYPENLLSDLGKNAEFYGACDPSLGRDMAKGDYSAIIVLARDKRNGLLYIVEADIGSRAPDKIIEDILAYHSRYRFVRFGFETNQFQEFLAASLENEARLNGLYFWVEKINNKTNKIVRIQSLQPWVKNGTIWFCSLHRQLLDECRYFPKGRHDDGLDALEMAVRVAGIGFSGNYDDPELFMAANNIPSVNKGRGRVTGIQNPGTGEIMYEDWMDWVCPRRKKR
jgi:predicted phage terminase large subunit-like protein